MEDFILKPKRFLLLGYSLLGILMMSTCYFCLPIANIFHNNPPVNVQFGVFIGILLLGVSVIIIFIKLLTVKPIWIVNKDGILCFDILIPWSNIKGFSIYNLATSSFVIIEVENFDYLCKQLSFLNKMLTKGNIPYIGKNFLIPPQGTDYEAIELKDILQKYVETYRVQSKLIN